MMEHTLNSIAKKEKKVPYSFRPNHPPLSVCNPMSGVEKSFFCAAAKYELKFFRVQTRWGQRIYKLGNEHSFADFSLKDGGVRLLLLQGDEDFLNKFAKVVFECGAKRIFGAASIEAPNVP